MTSGLANLIAELEHRLGGRTQTDRLQPHLGDLIPEGATYVLALFDGLGVHQLANPAARELRSSLAATLHAPFPTTTTVSLSTIATGTEPISHGTIGHQMWIPGLEKVVNVLKWMTPFGQPVAVDTTAWLPGPNLWERLKQLGIEPITVQPGNFAATPLTRALYRGARIESVYTDDERIEATLQLAREPNRLIFTYFAEVDVAAHIAGQDSDTYLEALTAADNAWSALAQRLPDHAVLVGTSDHGHIDYAESSKILIRDPAYDALTFFGDPRALMIKGDIELASRLADEVGAALIDTGAVRDRLGSGVPHPDLDQRLPSALLDAPVGALLLPRGFDRRLTGYHGGLDDRERDIPLLIG